MSIKFIEPWVISFFKTQSLVVLRRKKDNFPLNVSYTEDGLKWTANKIGRCLYFKDGFIRGGKIDSSMELSDEVYVSHFVPINHRSESAQSAECLWTKKALGLLSLRVDYTKVFKM